MAETYFLLFGACFCLTGTLYLVSSQNQREFIYRRCRFRTRRASCATTPPRSLSPQKKNSGNAPPKSKEYLSTFPPSVRGALVKVAQEMPAYQRDKLGDIDTARELDPRSLIPFTTIYSNCDVSKYTATGLSIKEIKALGDFPNYAELSGVPLPSPYHEFDIDKARARPYRPFRWKYHQTMCKATSSPQAQCLLTMNSPHEARGGLVARAGDDIQTTYHTTQSSL